MDLGIHAGRVITPTEEIADALVAVEGGLIRSVEPWRPGGGGDFKTFVEAPDRILVPGFVDIQVNGGLGFNFKGAREAERLEIYKFFLAHGTTTLVPTIVTDKTERLVESLRALAGDVGAKGQGRPEVPGLHLEGPFLNPERRGAHPPEYLLAPDPDLARRFWDASGGKLAILTLAPELEGADRLIRWFAERGVVVAAGHTLATYGELLAACDAGLSLITHIGNVSDWPHRRRNAEGILASEPGVVGTFMICERLRASIILDGYHFHPKLAAVLVRLRGPQSLALISDASYATGCPPGDYDDGLIRTTVHPDGYAYATDGGGWLAGSVITLERAVQVAVRDGGIPLCKAVEMTTLTPAQILGLADRKGRIEKGFEADLVLLDSDLAVRRVFRAGVEVAP